MAPSYPQVIPSSPNSPKATVYFVSDDNIVEQIKKLIEEEPSASDKEKFYKLVESPEIPSFCSCSDGQQTASFPIISILPICF